MRIASSSAQSFDSLLIERFASVARARLDRDLRRPRRSAAAAARAAARTRREAPAPGPWGECSPRVAPDYAGRRALRKSRAMRVVPRAASICGRSTAVSRSASSVVRAASIASANVSASGFGTLTRQTRQSPVASLGSVVISASRGGGCRRSPRPQHGAAGRARRSRPSPSRPPSPLRRGSPGSTTLREQVVNAVDVAHATGRRTRCNGPKRLIGSKMDSRPPGRSTRKNSANAACLLST